MTNVDRRVLSNPIEYVTPAGVTLMTIDPHLAEVIIPDGSRLFMGGAQTPAAVGSGYKIARGVHVQAAASDTVVSGLATVVAVIASFQDAPTVKQLSLSATVGDQSGAPAAGSFLIKTYKPTAVNDVTPVPATDFTDNARIEWIAVGT